MSSVQSNAVETVTDTIPSIKMCLALMDECGMLANIREHSFVVARVAEKLFDELEKNPGISDLPPKQLIIAGALLHDIAKTICLETGCDHAVEGSKICRQRGFEQVAGIVREHVLLQKFEENRYQRGIFQAKEFIFYADKRVVHDTIVTLPERLTYILERYGNNDAERRRKIRYNFDRCVNLEKWFCKYAGCDAEELVADIQKKTYS